MSDIVDRLRNRDREWRRDITSPEPASVWSLAADEIERLRGVLREIANADDCYEPPNGVGCKVTMPNERNRWCVFCLAADAIGLEKEADDE